MSKTARQLWYDRQLLLQVEDSDTKPETKTYIKLLMLFATLRRPLKAIHFDQKKFIYCYIFKRFGVGIQIGSSDPETSAR